MLGIVTHAPADADLIHTIDVKDQILFKTVNNSVEKILTSSAWHSGFKALVAGYSI
jgi:hypothetical protein